MSVRVALADGIAALTGVSDTARLDAELLMAHALGVDRGAMLIDPDRHAVPPDFAAMVARRKAHEPIAYIIGYRDFWTIRLSIGPGALIPPARQRDADRSSARPFWRDWPAHHPRPWHRPGDIVAGSTRPMATGARRRHRRVRSCLGLCRMQCSCDQGFWAGDICAWRLGRWRSGRSAPVQPTIY